MSMTYHERPGVYVEYDTTSRAVSSSVRTVGIAALGQGSMQRYYLPSVLTNTAGDMISLALAAGAAQVVFYPVSANTTAAYTAAVTELLNQGEVSLLAVETENANILADIAALLCQSGTRECIAFAGMSEPTAAELATMAQSLNCERMVLLGGDVRMAGEEDYGGGCLAAASMAGLLSAQSDPALPLHGSWLPGLEASSLRLTEAQIDTLVGAGVTPLETIGGQVRLIRAVTTRTTTNGIADPTWRELTTMCILDDLIPSVRNALASKFLRRKNTAITRRAIRTQTAIVLDDRVRREIIESYEALSVDAVEGDPSACRVSFTFQVVHGLSRIHLNVHIIV